MTRTPTELDTLLQIADLFQRDMARAFAGTGLTAARTHLLWILAERGPSTQQALATGLGVSARNVTGLVDALERSGHVRRRPHPTDRRAVLVALSAQGERTMRAMEREHEELSADLVGAVAPDDRAAFSRGLEAVAARLRELVEAAAAGAAGRADR